MTRVRAILLSAVVGLLGGQATASASMASTLTDLQGLDAFRARFNEDAGKIRIVLLLSPT